jgi:uncharacterized membrane protein
MAPWLVVLLLWIAFGATHVALTSTRLRPRLVARLGESAYLGLYSLIALATFVPLVWVYIVNRHTGSLLWGNPLGPVSLWVLDVVMGVAFVLVVAGLVQPSPFALGKLGQPTVRGVHRLTRHALFMGTGLFGALHLVPNGFASDVAFFAGFPVFVLLGCWHQDQRKLQSEGERFRAWCVQTPFLPFTGRETLRGLRELPVWVTLLGIVLTVGFRWLHDPLFR